MATSRVLANPITNASNAISRIGLNSFSGGACRNEALSATTASTIASSGTPVDSAHASSWRPMTPVALMFSGSPPRKAATATGRSTRSDCR